MTKKIFAMFLAVLMVVSMLPTSVFAADNCPGADAVHTKNNCDYTQVGEPVAPTCGTQGYTNYKCNECGKNFIADQVAAAGEHTWVDAKDEPETCLQNGKTGGKECSVCHAKVEQTEVDNIPNGFTCDMEDLTPTINCMTGGKKQYKCKVCGRTEEGEEIKENTPHTWKAWELKTAPTATENGLAERKCEKCGETEQVVVFPAHDHVMIDGESKAPKCEKAGVEEHKVCRICGVKFQWEKPEGASAKQWVEKTDADLAIPSLHDQLKAEADCLHLTKVCEKANGGCGEVINFADVLDHEWELNPTHANAWAATCTTAGNEVYTCKTEGCPAIKTNPIKPLDHIYAEVKVKATCDQYAYTFTYCLRQNCKAVNGVTKSEYVDEDGNTFNVEAPAFNPIGEITEAVIGADLFFGSFDADGNPLALDGKFWVDDKGKEHNYRLNITDKIADAAIFYIEAVEDVEGGYYIYTIEKNDKGEDVKTYIEVYTYDGGSYTGYSIRKTETTPVTCYKWNAEYKTLTTTINDEEMFLAQRLSKGGYLYAIKKFDMEKNDKKNFADYRIFQLVSAEEGPVQLLNIVVDYKGDKNPENHADAKKVTTLVPTCQEGVTNTWLCYACGDTWTKEEAKVDHKWVADATKDCPDDCAKTHEHVKDGVQKATCTAKGVKYFVCDYKCGETKEVEEAAKGHTAVKYEEGHAKEGQDVVDTSKGGHEATTIYDYKTCKDCGEQIEKTNYRLWEGVGKIWDVLDCGKTGTEACGKCATCAHDHKLAAEAEVEVKGDCFKVGYKGYKCDVCKEVVRVKVAGTNEHLPYAGEGITVGEGEEAVVYGGANGEPMRVEPTCTEDGYFVNYKCSRCNKLIDETKKENEVVVLVAKDHTWKELNEEERKAAGWTEKYVAAPCDTPNYENWIAICEVCGEKNNDGTKKLNEFTIPSVAGLCGEMVYEWYTCHCGENHMRNFVGEIKHVLENATDADLDALKELEGFDGKLKVDASCTAAGYVWKKCTFCGEFVKETLAKLPHENKAEEKFTDSCIDEVDDRHCVKCCNCTTKKDHDCTADQNKDVDGVQTCPCVIKANVHNWDRTETFVPSVCGSLPYSMRVCKDCGKTEITNYPGYWDEKTVDKDGKPVLSPIVGLNHTPVAYTTGDKYANLKYLPAEQYIYSLNENGILVLDVVSYEGIYKAYTEPTFTTAGSATFVCSQCGEEVTIEIPALSGLGFELVVENANGQAGITKGSVVNVTLYANGNNVEVNNFTLNAEFKSMIFVGAKPANDNFNIHVTKAEGANKAQKLEIVANAINTADKKQQNIAIGEKTPVVTLTFIAWGEGETDVKMDGKAFALDAKGVEDAINCTPKACEIEIKALYDFNEDGFVHTSDLVQAEAILTGESEKTYDATVDADKDGEITLYDLNLIFEYMVNKTFMTEEELVEFACIGLADEYVAIVRQYLNNAEEATKHECIGKYCTYSADEKFDVCPVCKTVQ